MEFLDRHAEGFELMLILDADSAMTPEAVLRLVVAMRDDPTLGIVQHLTVGLPASSAFPRLFQFGMRAGMRTWATALAWWQGDSCVYWGHNAVVRIAPFRAICRLPLLPNGAHILSHDQVEAAMLRGAGWGIRLVAEEDGSYEANPPALPEFMRRELRWLAGNFEYRHLLRMPGLRPMGRWQLVQAIMLFASPPFYLAFLLAAAWAAASDTTSAFPLRPALAATVIWSGALYAPKLTGYLEILLSREKRMLYGGGARVAIGIALETVFTLLLDAINVVAKTIAMGRVALGLRAAWTPQNRADRGVSWVEAARLLWPQTLLGLLVFAGFSRAGWTASAWAAVFAGGLVVAIPFCVITADPRFGARLRAMRVAAVPEELESEG
jgi:membrane glycosyltransferase